MGNLFTLLILLSLVCLPIGLIKPSLFHFLQKGKPTRLKISLTLIGILIASFVLFGITYPPKSTKVSTAVTKLTQAPTKAPAPTTVVKKVEVTPTPTPTDWVGNPLCNLNNPDGLTFDQCLMEKYPLPATVRTDGYSILVTNPQSVEWTSCTVVQDYGNYGMNLYDTFSVEPGTTASVAWGRLADDNGNRFDYSKMQPGAINISCTANHAQHESQFSGF